jgi:hypothetical protein
VTATLPAEARDAVVDDDERLAAPGDPPPIVPDDVPDGEDEVGPILRPLGVAALSASATALMAGGIFGSWTARSLALFGALLGVGWAYVCLRAEKRRLILELLALPAAFLVGILSLLPAGQSPSKVFDLMGEAVNAGRLLRPPVPFDPGWRPVLIVVLALVGFATAWVAAAVQKPQLALVLPLPVLFLTAISQPAEGEFIGGMVGFLPLLIALGVLFGGERSSLSELSSTFELRRALKSAPLVIGGVLLLVVLNNADFLFPKPVYNPAEKPQKPKAIPLGEVRDRVLFEIEGDLTGPWKTGTLDVYDGRNWRLPPFDPKRLEKVPGDGVVDDSRIGDVHVKLTTRDLGTTSVLPGVAGPTAIQRSGLDVRWDERVGIFRMNTGAVPQNATYELSIPKYPTETQLATAVPADGVDRDFTFIPKPTPVVQALLAEAPTRPWDRLAFLRKKLNDVVIAVGAGAPNKDVPPSKVDDLLTGSHEGSPFEIVAAEAMLARWAGVPSRIGYGFDGFNDEDGTKTVRPKNGSNWLEVNFEGYGWVPLIQTPPKAKASLDNDPNARFDPTILPSEDVAVELYVPIEVDDLTQLYQQIRALLLRALPYVVLALAVYFSLPALRRALRRRKRRAWAAAIGPVAQIAVEYAEFRDAVTDLNVGDLHATPLEFLLEVAEDDEHAELAWLTTRALYGDLRDHVTAEDAERAEEMSASLRRRMLKVQPFQSRVLAALSRASLRTPYTLEVPTVRQLRLRRERKRPAGRKVSRRLRLQRAAHRVVSRSGT